jgi:hypothetical protein
MNEEAPAKRKRKSVPKRQVPVSIPYGTEVKDIFTYVTDSKTGDKKRARISDDAVRVVSEILERVGQKCIETAEEIADPSRETLFCSDLANAVRMTYLFSPEQEQLAKRVMDVKKSVRSTRSASTKE